MNLKSFFMVFLITAFPFKCTADPNNIKSIYKDALNFDQDLQNTRGKVEHNKGVYYEDLYAYLPAPLVTYGKERIETTFGNNVTSITHPASLKFLIMQNISAPKVFRTMSAKNLYTGSKEALRANHSVLIYSILSEYTKILSAHAALGALEAKIDRLQHILATEHELLKQNKTTQVNVELAQTTYSAAINQRFKIKQLLDLGINSLYRLTGQFYHSLPALSSDLDFDHILIPRSIEQYEASAMQNNGNIADSRYTVEAAKDQMSATRGNFLPYISYTILYNKNENQQTDLQLIKETNVQSIGLTYNFGNNPGTIVAQQGDLTRTIAQNRQLVTKIISGIHTGYDNLLHLKGTIKQFKITIPNAIETVNTMEKQYIKGNTRLSELLTAINHLEEYQTQQASSQYNALLYYTQLMVLAGDSPEKILRQINPLLQGRVVMHRIYHSTRSF